MSTKIKNIALTIAATIQGIILWINDTIQTATNISEILGIIRILFEGYSLSEIKVSFSNITFWSFIGLCFINVVIYVIDDKFHKRWLRRLLKHIMDQDLLGNNAKTRITIYTRNKGYVKFLRTALYALRMTINKRDVEYLTIIPIPWRTYLFPYVRHSYPSKSPSYTHFRVNQSELMSVNSVVQQCYKRGEVIRVQTQDLEGIDFNKNYAGLTKSEKNRINKYSRDTHINKSKSEAFIQLKLMQRRANQLYAFPLLKEQYVWGVLIVDAVCDLSELNLIEKMDAVFENYQKIIQLTFDEKR